MATGATQLGETLTPAGDHRRVQGRCSERRDGAVGNRQHRRGDGAAREAGAGEIKCKGGLPSRMVIIEPKFAPTCREGGLAFDRLRSAAILGRQRHDFLAVHRQRGPVGFQGEGVIAGRGEVDPAFEAHRQVVVDAVQVRQREVRREAGALRFDRLVADAFPDLAAIHRVIKVAWHHRVAKQVVGDAFQFAGRQAEVGHAQRRAAEVRLAKEVHQAAETVFPFQRPEGDGGRRQRLPALGVAG